MPTQIDELTDRVIIELGCVVPENLVGDGAISEQNLASGAYKQGWRIKRLVNPKAFKKGTCRLAVCGDCIKAGGAK